MTGRRRAAAMALACLPAAAHAADRPADTATIGRGQAVFNYWCASCHGDGRDKPGTIALGVKYNGARPALLEQRTDLPPPLVKFFVRNGISIMPFFRKTEIGDPDLEALAAYLSRNTR